MSFPKASELKEHLELLEQAKLRDHRKLGQELELFMFSEKVGAGLPMWLPRGTQLRERLINYLKERQADMGYQQVTTPHIGKKELYVTSGHYAKYGEDSFQPIKTPREDEEFLLKPMNCPHHCEMYKFRPRSYKELPVRFAEFGTVYRYEQSGELHGLSRVRGFTQDDAHIFCTPEQVQKEFLDVVALTQEVLHMIGFDDVTAQISLRDPAKPEKYIGSDEDWAQRRAGHYRRLRLDRHHDGDGLRRGGLLRPEARLHGPRRPQAPVAARHRPGGLQPPEALRARVHRGRQPAAPPRHDPPRALRASWSASRRS